MERGARELPLPPPQAIAGCLVVPKIELQPTLGHSTVFKTQRVYHSATSVLADGSSLVGLPTQTASS